MKPRGSRSWKQSPRRTQTEIPWAARFPFPRKCSAPACSESRRRISPQTKQCAQPIQGCAHCLLFLDILFDTSYINFHLVYNFGGMDGAVRDVLFNGKPLASTMASLQSSAEAAIKEFCETWGKQ